MRGHSRFDRHPGTGTSTSVRVAGWPISPVPKTRTCRRWDGTRQKAWALSSKVLFAAEFFIDKGYTENLDNSSSRAGEGIAGLDLFKIMTAVPMHKGDHNTI